MHLDWADLHRGWQESPLPQVSPCYLCFMSQDKPVLSLTCLPGPTLGHSGGADTVSSPSPGLWLSPSLHCYLTTPRAIPQHLLTAQQGAEQEAVLVQRQLAQEINGQES